MNAMLGTPELELFQRAVAERLGLRFDDSRITFLAEVLDRGPHPAGRGPDEVGQLGDPQLTHATRRTAAASRSTSA